jgi:hypothetical protein
MHSRNFVVDVQRLGNHFLREASLAFDQPLDSVVFSSVTRSPEPEQASKLGASATEGRGRLFVRAQRDYPLLRITLSSERTARLGMGLSAKE